MDFFGHQEAARKQTGRLVLLFALAVLAIIVSTYLVVAGAIFGFGQYAGGDNPGAFHPAVILGVGAATLLIIGAGTTYKIAQLRGGGRVIAEMLGGQRLEPGSGGPAQRKVLNVVEEMAIASGTPVPPVYLMPRESGINAFAAGYSLDDAVIGVTRGSAELLSRDELQGVIAHEFSHILNGDMRLNIRLIGWLNGILVIGLIGHAVLRTAAYSGGGRRRSKEGGGAVVAMLVIGVGLMTIGFLGTFFGNLIKSAVSRQREYLADASAVQFTRNPSGIGNALRKIGGNIQGSRLFSPRAAEASHMYFGQGVASGLSSLLATHPPLEDRIRRIDPSWDGTFLETASAAPYPREPEVSYPELQRRKRETIERLMQGAVVAEAVSGDRVRRLVDYVGAPTPAHVARAKELIALIPQSLVEAAREPYSARAVVYCMLLNRDAEVRSEQMQALQRQADPGTYVAVQSLLPGMDALDAGLRLPLVELAAPALREMSGRQYEAFAKNVAMLVEADRKINFFEYALQHMIRRHVGGHFHRRPAQRVDYYSLKRLGGPISTLLSVLAYSGARDAEAARRAFESGAARVEAQELRLLPVSECSPAALDAALETLNTISSSCKRDLLNALAEAVASDREVKVTESELLRAFADALECPMPPLLPGPAPA